MILKSSRFTCLAGSLLALTAGNALANSPQPQDLLAGATVLQVTEQYADGSRDVIVGRLGGAFDADETGILVPLAKHKVKKHSPYMIEERELFQEVGLPIKRVHTYAIAGLFVDSRGNEAFVTVLSREYVMKKKAGWGTPPETMLVAGVYADFVPALERARDMGDLLNDPFLEEGTIEPQGPCQERCLLDAVECGRRATRMTLDLVRICASTLRNDVEMYCSGSTPSKFESNQAECLEFVVNGFQLCVLESINRGELMMQSCSNGGMACAANCTQ